MITIAYYFLQVILCSGMLMGYYWLVLRNKRFHQYNRFYLLLAAVLSWIVPLIKIRWGHHAISEDPEMMRLLSVVADNNSELEQTITAKGFRWNWDTIATGLYLTVATILLFGMIHALYRLYHLLKVNSCKNVGDVYLVLTQAKGTPFSFFRYIFWNEEIDIRSEAGKQILQHELTHVQQKHSFDKLLIQLMLIGGWFNPFFWLLRKEMDMIHEFIADKKAVNNGDTASLAHMLLTAAYPQQQFALSHPFFFSPIKRRLQMLTNNRNPRFSYIRRLIVLPLLAVVIVLFAFRNKEQRTAGTISVETITGSVLNDINKNFTQLLLTKNDKAPAVDPGTGDHAITNLPGKQKNGTELIKYNGDGKEIMELTTKSFGKAETIPVERLGQLIKKPDTLPTEMHWVTGIKVNDTADNKNGLRLNGANPLVMIDGVKNKFIFVDPNDISTINVLKGDTALALYGEEGRNGVIEIRTKGMKRKLVDGVLYEGPAPSGETDVPASFPGGSAAWVQYLERNLDRNLPAKKGGPPGKYTVVVSFTIDKTGGISNIEPLNDPGYGTKEEAARMIANGPKWVPAKHNGMAITSVHKQSVTFIVAEFKKPVTQQITPGTSVTAQNIASVYTNPQVPATFPGGQPAWLQYLQKNLNLDMPVKKGAPLGKLVDTLHFIVHIDGTISNIQSNDPGYGVKEEAMRIIANGPKWIPATQDGKNVASVHTKTVTFVIGE